MLAASPSCWPALPREAVRIAPPKLSFAAASGGNIPLRGSRRAKGSSGARGNRPEPARESAPEFLGALEAP